VGEWPQLAARLDELHHAGADTTLLARRLAKVPAAVALATLTRHEPGAAVQVDWRPWAQAVNPALLGEGWGSVQADLTRLQAAGTDLTALARRLAGRDPEKAIAGLRNVLRNLASQRPTGSKVSEGPEMMTLQGLWRGVGRDDGSRGV